MNTTALKQLIQANPTADDAAILALCAADVRYLCYAGHVSMKPTMLTNIADQFGFPLPALEILDGHHIPNALPDKATYQSLVAKNPTLPLVLDLETPFWNVDIRTRPDKGVEAAIDAGRMQSERIKP